MCVNKVRLVALISVLSAACASENPVGPGAVTVTVTTSTTTTSTIAPTATAQFVFAPTTPAPAQPVFFNAFGSTAGRGTRIVSFAWDFGDGGTATGMSVSHTYADQALYAVTLTVTDDVGDIAKVSQIVGATAPPVTTTIPPATGAAHYVGNQANPIIPSDMTLFFRLLSSAEAVHDGPDGGGLQAAAADQRYRVDGTFRAPNGTTGTARGDLIGTLEPAPKGTFTGRLTANPAGCSATRNFSGPLDEVSLQWTAGSMVSNTCSTNPLGFTRLNLVVTTAPPATTTSSVPTTTTTAPPTTTTVPVSPLTGGAITSSPSGTGIVSTTVYSFQYATSPTGGVPPYTYSWNFGDGSATGSGTSPTHIFSSTGNLTVTATVTDSVGATASTQTPVSIGNVTSTWTVVYTAFGDNKYSDTVVLTQNQTQVSGTVAHNGCSVGAATGTVSNVRSLTVNSTLECDGSFPISYQGTLDVPPTLMAWTGHVIGGTARCAGTACPFTASRSTGATGVGARGR
jgi:PKD repeat protein